LFHERIEESTVVRLAEHRDEHPSGSTGDFEQRILSDNHGHFFSP